MSRITIALVLAVSMICFSCNRTPEPANQNAQSADKGGERTAPRALAADATLATIIFNGLMVLHKDRTTDTYEIGVIPATDHGHVFKFTIDGLPESVPDKNWTVEITNLAPATAMPEGKGHLGRRPDDRNGAYDFDWVIDLEGPEFHDKDLPYKEGVLNPIIHLPNGRIYTKYKSIDLVRQRGKGGVWSDFGFVPEGMAIDLELQKDQSLILKNDKGVKKVLFSYPSPGNHIVNITNTLPSPGKTSDFHLFYDLLLQGVPDAEQYDFDAEPKDKSYVPYNLRPNFLRTCCAMACSTPLLSRRAAPLK